MRNHRFIPPKSCVSCVQFLPLQINLGQLFVAYATDGSGYLQPRQLAAMLRRVLPALTDDEALEMVERNRTFSWAGGRVSCQVRKQPITCAHLDGSHVYNYCILIPRYIHDAYGWHGGDIPPRLACAYQVVLGVQLMQCKLCRPQDLDRAQTDMLGRAAKCKGLSVGFLRNILRQA